MASPPPTSRAPVARAPRRRPSVLGWLALAVSGVVVLALGGFYVLTMPRTLSAADLPKHTPTSPTASGCSGRAAA